MGIYYYAVDNATKTIMEPPETFANKCPGVFYPGNPFPAMVMMENCYGSRYEIINDMQAEYEECCTWRDVTQEVYNKLLKIHPEWKEDDQMH